MKPQKLSSIETVIMKPYQIKFGVTLPSAQIVAFSLRESRADLSAHRPEASDASFELREPDRCWGLTSFDVRGGCD